MININHGKNQDLLEQCKPLQEYAWFIDRIRSTKIETDDLEEAVNEAIETMPDDFIIKPFLICNKREVEGMLDTEYNEEKIRNMFKADARREIEAERKRAEEANLRAEEANLRAEEAAIQVKALEAEIQKLKAQLAEANKG